MNERDVVDRIRELANREFTGKVELHFKDGHVNDVFISEHIRTKPQPLPPPPSTN